MTKEELLNLLRCSGVNVDNADTQGWFELGRQCEYEIENERAIGLAEECYLQGASEGNLDCMFSIGGLIAKGYPGLKISENAAAGWLLQAAGQGHVRSMTMLGYWLCNYRMDEFLQGKKEGDVPALALKWLTLAAEQGDAEAQLYLGREYARGRIVEKSYDDAVKWLLRSALQGMATAQLCLGDFYCEYGNFPEALHAYDCVCRLVNAQGFSEDRFCAIDECGVENDGRVEARLAYLYRNGLGVEADRIKAEELQKVAEEKIGPHRELLDPKLFSEI